MAVTGLILFGFLIGHVLGNLQFFAGREKINAYAEFLHHSPWILWGTRVLLLFSVIVHVGTAVQLYYRSDHARPIPYAVKGRVAATTASKTMLWSGVAILVFVVYHLLHFTWGVVHPAFEEKDGYHNLVAGFREPIAVAAYVFALALLALHLSHGLWSMSQSVGIGHPSLSRAIKRSAVFVAVALALAFVSIPIAVLAGVGS